jgi:hypothetical protein
VLVGSRETEQGIPRGVDLQTPHQRGASRPGPRDELDIRPELHRCRGGRDRMWCRAFRVHRGAVGLGVVTEGAIRSNGVALIVTNVDACLPVDNSTCQGGPKTVSPRPIS